MAALSSKDLSIYKTTADNIGDGESASEMKARLGPKFVIIVVDARETHQNVRKKYGKEIL